MDVIKIKELFMKFQNKIKYNNINKQLYILEV